MAEVAEQIGEVTLSPPQKRIGMAVWSLQKIREYLQKQKIVGSISREWLRQLLRRERIHWRHTKTWKDSDDPQFWPKYRRIRRLYRRRPAGGRRLCVDEFGPLNLQPRHGMHDTRTGHVDRLRGAVHTVSTLQYDCHPCSHSSGVSSGTLVGFLCLVGLDFVTVAIDVFPIRICHKP
jgi:hypothetical protein